MFEKLLETEKHFDGLSEQLQDPDVVSNQENYTKLMKEYKRLTPIVDTFRALKKAQRSCLTAGTKSLKSLPRRSLKRRRNKSSSCRSSLKSSFSPPTQTTTATLLWKSAAEREGKRRRFLREVFSVCIPCMPKARAGKPK